MKKKLLLIYASKENSTHLVKPAANTEPISANGNFGYDDASLIDRGPCEILFRYGKWHCLPELNGGPLDPQP
jgi:hypothetical protein